MLSTEILIINIGILLSFVLYKDLLKKCIKNICKNYKYSIGVYYVSKVQKSRNYVVNKTINKIFYDI